MTVKLTDDQATRLDLARDAWDDRAAIVAVIEEVVEAEVHKALEPIRALAARWDHSEHESTDEEGRPICRHPDHGGWRVHAPCADTPHGKELLEVLGG